MTLILQDNVDSLVDKKNSLVLELAGVLQELENAKVDKLCDAELRTAVNGHMALELLLSPEAQDSFLDNYVKQRVCDQL